MVVEAGKGESVATYGIPIPERHTPYMPMQHTGGHWAGTGQHGKAIPTDEARNGGNPDKKVKKQYLLRNIKRVKRTKGRAGDRGKGMGELVDAAKSGYKYVFRDHQKGGQFLHIKKRPGNRAPKITTLYNVVKSGVTVNRSPWFDEGLSNMRSRFDRHVKKDINFQFRHHLRRAKK